MREVNEATLNLVKDFEGFRPKPYLDVAKVWTIGYGHTRTVYNGMVVTQAQAEQLLAEDMRLTSRAVERLVTVTLNDNQFGALCSFAYNVGVGNFERSTLLTLLNRGWFESVPAQLVRWNRASGIVVSGLARRRMAEARLWNTPEQMPTVSPVNKSTASASA